MENQQKEEQEREVLLKAALGRVTLTPDSLKLFCRLSGMKLIRIDHVLLILSLPEAQCSEHSLTSGYAHIILFFQN